MCPGLKCRVRVGSANSKAQRVVFGSRSQAESPREPRRGYTGFQRIEQGRDGRYDGSTPVTGDIKVSSKDEHT